MRSRRSGEIIAQGTPEDVAKEPRSYTGQYLAPLLKNGVRDESGPAMKLTKAKARPRASKREREAAE